jgi:hypothetical protein
MLLLECCFSWIFLNTFLFFFSFFQTPITYYATTWRFILINILCKCCYDWSSCYIPGESVRAGSDEKTSENGRKVEAVIRWSYLVAGFSWFQPELTITARIPPLDMITVLPLLPSYHFPEFFPWETAPFPRVPVGNPRNRGPESLSWDLLVNCSY